MAEYDAAKALKLGLGTVDQWADKFVNLGNGGDFVILGDVLGGDYQGPAFLNGREVSGQDGDEPWSVRTRLIRSTVARAAT